MSIIKEKRQQFATALERARHNSCSSLNEFNPNLSCFSSVESIDAFSDPFSSELSECSSIFNEESLCDLFDPTQWSSSTTALDSLPGSFELCEWDLNRHQPDPFQAEQNSLDLSCGESDFLATAEDTMEVLSRIASESGDINTGQSDFIDIIDNRIFGEQKPDGTLHGSMYRDLLDDMIDTSFTTCTADNNFQRPNLLKKDPWLFNGSPKDLTEVPQLSTISPQGCFMGNYVPSSSTTQYSTNVATKRVVGGREKKCGKAKRQKLTPEDLLERKEKNRLRSKAYRERRKLQFESLKEQVILANLEANIAKRQNMKLAKRR